MILYLYLWLTEQEWANPCGYRDTFKYLLIPLILKAVLKLFIICVFKIPGGC